MSAGVERLEPDAPARDHLAMRRIDGAPAKNLCHIAILRVSVGLASAKQSPCQRGIEALQFGPEGWGAGKMAG
jgi:hypothetical protein